jgi:hypothetical protein
MGVDIQDLDITLRNARLINPWLASWLIEAANNPEAVKGWLDLPIIGERYRSLPLRDVT